MPPPAEEPSSEPLETAYALIASGRWTAPTVTRDRSNDMTDEQIAALL